MKQSWVIRVNSSGRSTHPRDASAERSVCGGDAPDVYCVGSLCERSFQGMIVLNAELKSINR